MTMTVPEANLLFESCNCTWVFDTRRMRFRRILKGLGLTSRCAATSWRRYYGLEADPGSESFAVVLNPQRTRRLRSWRHVARCPQCGADGVRSSEADFLRDPIAS